MQPKAIRPHGDIESMQEPIWPSAVQRPPAWVAGSKFLVRRPTGGVWRRGRRRRWRRTTAGAVAVCGAGNGRRWSPAGNSGFGLQPPATSRARDSTIGATRVRLPSIEGPRVRPAAIGDYRDPPFGHQHNEGSACSHRRLPGFGFWLSEHFRVRVLAIDKTRVRLLSIQALKTALNGQKPNPCCVHGRKANPRLGR